MKELETIYHEYRGKVLGYLYHKTNNAAVAEDLCSDVFLKITEHYDSYDPTKARLSTWIYCITQNTLYDYFRTKHESCELDETIPEDNDFVNKLCNDEMLGLLADALKTLPRRERELLIRRYYYGEDLKTAAARLDLSYSYVRMLHKSSLQKIKKIMKI